MLATVLCILNAFSFLNVVQAELYSSISDFEIFLETEMETVSSLDKFTKVQMKMLEDIQDCVMEYKLALNLGIKSDLDNPVELYLTMKKFSLLWSPIETKLLEIENKAIEVLEGIEEIRQSRNVHVPLEEDLQMSREALVRLQTMYNLHPTDMVSGNIKGVKKLPLFSLDAKDCYEIGLIYMNKKDYKNGLLWFVEALTLLDKQDDNYHTADRIDILKYYAYATFKQGQQENAISAMSSIVELMQNEETFYEHIISYQKNLTMVTDVEKKNKSIQQISRENVAKLMKSLCQGENLLNNSVKSTLFCYYKSDTPFLQLAPFKVEVLHFNPTIYLYHQVISTEEGEILKSLAKPKLTRAAVVDAQGKAYLSDDRTAKHAWIFDHEHEVVNILNKRIEDMTNLDLTTAEYIQVAHYGIGGHYELHYDAAKNKKVNNRIATVLFYLSTPIAGGATVFPFAKTAVTPNQNDAVFWYNLLQNGKRDLRTKHAGCPVLLGKKWIVNKWIHEYGQEFKRKCSLDENE